jgi:hypothetical protein
MKPDLQLGYRGKSSAFSAREFVDNSLWPKPEEKDEDIAGRSAL